VPKSCLKRNTKSLWEPPGAYPRIERQSTLE